ncbi:TetR/AcrR family transcriptional regulator [Streptomyces griseorubiginosus]|uniref:TetR/AcrR family transcriptional regulator n=1 Tax=Streptomyces griseorubiginosus TaxID=67304 RepID=UPI0033B69CE9
MAARSERRRPEERRQEMIDTALVLADTLSLDRLTSRDVAEAMGVTSGLVHHYFPTVDDLIVAAFRQFAEGQLAEERRLTEGLSPLEALRAFVAHELDITAAMARLWMGAWAAAARRPALAAVVDEQMLAGLKLVTSLLEDGTAAGVFHTENPQASAFRLLVLVDGVLVQKSMRAEATYGDVPSLVWRTAEREVGLPPGTLY